jgi:hypothetical protein
LETKWHLREQKFKSMGVKTVKVPGNGLCFLESIRVSLLKDHGKEMSVSEMQNRTMNQMLERKEFYRQFATGDKTSDDIVNDAIRYMVSPFSHYSEEIMDIVVMAVVEACNLELNIYEKGAADELICITLHSSVPSKLKKAVNVVFSRDDIGGLGNHYNALVKSPRNAQPTLDFTTLREMTPQDWTEYNAYVDDDDDEDNDVMLQPERHTSIIRRGKRFQKSAFEGVEIEKVDRLPNDINGKHIYELELTGGDEFQKLQDGRYFKMNRTRKASSTYNRIGKCLGHFECGNVECGKNLLTKQPMYHQWQLIGGVRSCNTCGSVPDRKFCGAVKYTEVDSLNGTALVYHTGDHICKAKPDTQANKKAMEEAIRQNPGAGTKRIRHLAVQEKLKERDFIGAREIAYRLQDTRQIRSIKRKERKNPLEAHDSLRACADYKRELDEELKVKYYVYEVNDRRATNTDSYVFKSSKIAGQTAIGLDKDGDGPLAGEVVYFDGLHTRVKGYKVLTLWVYNFIARKLQRLATMEVKSESTDCISQFFVVLNRMLSDIKGEKYVFNPSHIMVDENAANFAAIKKVYGDEWSKRIITCHFHFLQNARNRSNRLPNDDVAEEFMNICKQICDASTMRRYNELVQQMYVLAEQHDNTEIPKWYTWWDKRRFHIFPCFRGHFLVNVNLSEQGQGGMTEGKNMMLIDACYSDTTYMMCQDVEYLKYLAAKGSSSGKGPNQLDKQIKESEIQRRRLRDYIQQIKTSWADLPGVDDIDDFVPPTGQKHRPAKRLGQRRKTQVRNVTKRQPRSKRVIQSKKPKRLRIIEPSSSSSDETESQLTTRLQLDTVMSDNSDDLYDTFDDVTHHSPSPTRPNGSAQRRIPSPLQTQVIVTPRPPLRDPFSPPNPVLITLWNKRITRCQGCPHNITENEDGIPPKDFVFSIIGRRQWIDRQTKQLLTQPRPGPMYFHLNPECVKKFMPTFTLREMRMTEEIFNKLTPEQIGYLTDIDFMQHLI